MSNLQLRGGGLTVVVGLSPVLPPGAIIGDADTPRTPCWGQVVGVPAQPVGFTPVLRQSDALKHDSHVTWNVHRPPSDAPAGKKKK